MDACSVWSATTRTTTTTATASPARPTSRCASRFPVMAGRPGARRRLWTSTARLHTCFDTQAVLSSPHTAIARSRTESGPCSAIRRRRDIWRYDYILRDDGPHPDLGYPSSVELDDGSILTVYYQRPRSVDDKCALLWSRWRIACLNLPCIRRRKYRKLWENSYHR